MGILKCFQDGFIFFSNDFFEHRGAYNSVPNIPSICDKCQSKSGLFYAHGRFKRVLNTLKRLTITKIKVWKNRWLCLDCNRTMSTGPPDVLPYIPNCTLIIIALLWGYLNGNVGIENCISPEFEGAASPRTVTRYLNRAKAISKETNQVIKEVLIKKKGPKPWDKIFAKGLSPPEKFTKCKHEAESAINLWHTLAMMLSNSDYLFETPCFLMAEDSSWTMEESSVPVTPSISGGVS